MLARFAAVSMIEGNTAFTVQTATGFDARGVDLICFMDSFHDLGDAVTAARLDRVAGVREEEHRVGADEELARGPGDLLLAVLRGIESLGRAGYAKPRLEAIADAALTSLAVPERN